MRTLKQVFNGMEKAKDHKGHISKELTVRQGEKPFVLVLMLKMLFQKAGEKPLIDRRNAHHVTFKQTLLGLPSLKRFTESSVCPVIRVAFLIPTSNTT